jgi:hypothetical protein
MEVSGQYRRLLKSSLIGSAILTLSSHSMVTGSANSS